MTRVDRADVAVIGAGFGGLATALRLAELGRRVIVHEALVYPGGCAGTFERGGHRFDAGATIAGGFGPNQPFERWRREVGLDVAVRASDPRLELRWAEGRLPVDADRDRFVARLGEPGDAVHAWFARQRRVADLTWATFEEPDLLPPLGWDSLARHAARLPRYARLLPLLGRPVGALLPPDAPPALRLWVDAGCRISVQCSAAEAQAIPALSALDWWWRGVVHVRGGMGALARALVAALRSLGGEVRFADRVRGLEAVGDGWRVTAREGVVEAPVVVANLLPGDLAALVGPRARLDRRQAEVRTGWGAVMQYAVVRPPPGAGPDAVHLQLVDDHRAPLVEANHVFASVSAEDDGFAPAGLRTMTLSTHADPGCGNEPGRRAEAVAAVQERMLRVLRARAPEWSDTIEVLPASPRTFARFVRRTGGWVGGVPQRIGRSPLAGIGHAPVLPGLWLVGDSVFPGQSTLGVTIGGLRVAARIAAQSRRR